MNIGPSTSGEFTCSMELPLLIADEYYRYFPVIAIFRRLPGESVSEWVMPNGRPRNDRDLAAEILVSVRHVRRTDRTPSTPELSISRVLQLDRAAALVVSTFLSVLPQPSE